MRDDSYVLFAFLYDFVDESVDLLFGHYLIFTTNHCS